MKITLNNVDPVNATLTVELVKDDYAKEVKKELKKIKDTAAVPGFRQGMAPQSMIEKKYGKAVMIDEINKIVGENLYKYIQDNNVAVLGEPLPNESQKQIDFDTQEDFEFMFDLAIAPEMNISLTKKDKIDYYQIKVEDADIDKQVENMKASYGTYEKAKSLEGKDMIKGVLIELDEKGKNKEGGIQIDDATMIPFFVKDEEEKAKFAEAKPRKKVVFNPFKAYEGNEAELSSFMRIDKKDIKDHTGDFSFKIEEITRYKEAELNQELFDKVFGKGVVKTEEEFRARLKEDYVARLTPESDYRFVVDAKEYLLGKTKDVVFPDAFLKRWLVESNEDRTPEAIEEDYPKILDDLKFHLIKEQIVKEKDIKVEREDLVDAAKAFARSQFAQYGMSNVPDELMDNYVQEMLKKEQTVRNLVDKVIEDKVVAAIKEKVTLKTKEVSMEDFYKLFEEK